jgi:hypothetical protein
MKKELVDKYEKMYFLENVEESKKEELSELFENFTNFLLKIGEEKLSWGKCDFAIIFIPLIRKLYVEYGETDYEKIYLDFKNWYDTEGVEWENTKEDIDLLDFLGLYIQNYKSKY